MRFKFTILISDIIAITVAFFVTFIFRYKLNIFSNEAELYFFDILIPAVVLSLFWIILFFYYGLYQFPVAPSRTDENLKVLKATFYGVIILFIITFNLYKPLSITRITLLFYWLALMFFTILGRSFLISFRRRRLENGIGLSNVLIVGWNPFAFNIFDKIEKFPALGYRVIGFISLNYSQNNGKKYKGKEVIGSIDSLPQLIKDNNIGELVIAFETSNHKRLLDVIDRVGNMDVGLKIIPDMYDIISGQARTNQIYGFPLIDIFPRLMPNWEKVIKRFIDIFMSVFALIFFLPFLLFFGLLIKIDSVGPTFYHQKRVGKNGKEFKIFKLRTMVVDAEKKSGPIWSQKDDPRITRIGRILRRIRLDEIPQFINVLEGHMSIVGPRPERPNFVDEFSKKIPLYKHRLKMKPGITGWAQIKHKYDESLDDVKEKLQYDLYYLENMSLRLDFKIILNTISIVFSAKGQ
ncbi:MAG: sugar transferase [Candidatus Marinimicrobia bacterium]|jgi:exopolysaccharide biosynthesis polyprenyl glycosylphosphotransferase|nr:sugar transferase [Candidatus Neomarinimicrobiota bacterium]